MLQVFWTVRYLCKNGKRMLDNNTYTRLLDSLIGQYKKENRFLEFKSNFQSPEALGKYISALSNGACLDHMDYGYLFFGVDNDTLRIKGTNFDYERHNVKMASL